jgi:hypothetical protein
MFLSGSNSVISGLSTYLCDNSIDAKLGDLLWYQGTQRLYTIYPQVIIIN